MSMVEMKVSELTGAALDYAVAMTQGWELDPNRPASEGQMVRGVEVKLLHRLRYSTDWSQGGPLIKEYKIDFNHTLDDGIRAKPLNVLGTRGRYGPTHLIAACRAIVAAKLGETVQIPAELAEVQS